jgi:hypothetical protein
MDSLYYHMSAGNLIWIGFQIYTFVLVMGEFTNTGGTFTSFSVKMLEKYNICLSCEVQKEIITIQ